VTASLPGYIWAKFVTLSSAALSTRRPLISHASSTPLCAAALVCSALISGPELHLCVRASAPELLPCSCSTAGAECGCFQQLPGTAHSVSGWNASVPLANGHRQGLAPRGSGVVGVHRTWVSHPWMLLPSWPLQPAPCHFFTARKKELRIVITNGRWNGYTAPAVQAARGVLLTPLTYTLSQLGLAPLEAALLPALPPSVPTVEGCTALLSQRH